MKWAVHIVLAWGRVELSLKVGGAHCIGIELN